jgi:hypothetical protein
LANRLPVAKSTKQNVYAYDRYNFNMMSVTNGTNTAVVLPGSGANSAGAPPPTMIPTVVSTTIVITGSIGPDFGVNTQNPV